MLRRILLHTKNASLFQYITAGPKTVPFKFIYILIGPKILPLIHLYKNSAKIVIYFEFINIAIRSQMTLYLII